MTELARDVVQTRDSRGNVSSELTVRIINELSRFAGNRLGMSRNETDEAISDFYPSLARVIHRYTPARSPFEPYLYSMFRIAINEQRRSLKRERQIQRMIETGSLGYRVFTPTVEYVSCEKPESSGLAVFSRSDDSYRKRLICAVCRDAANLSAAEMQRYTRELNLPDGWIQGIAVWAKVVLTRSFARLEYLRTLRDRYYAHYIKCETDLFECTDSDLRETLLRRMAVNKKRLQSTRWKMSRVRTQLTHSHLSTLLGIPKGSVDSCFALLRKTLARSRPFAVPSPHDGTSGNKQSAQAPGNARNNRSNGYSGQYNPSSGPWFPLHY